MVQCVSTKTFQKQAACSSLSGAPITGNTKRVTPRPKPPRWLIESGLAPADYWDPHERGKVRCRMCPRECTIRKNESGFCGARYNKEGFLMTAIWGKMLIPSIEPIETEAVYHFWPGAKILSIGNLGCNLRCDFCQNWESSDISNLSPEWIQYYGPDDVVRLAKHLGARVISFTYNDPAIWFEYVYETGKAAQQSGLKTVFKSAGFLSKEVACRLTEVIDIFSISLKTINPKTFSRISKGTLSAVLDAIKIFHASPRHLEISNLVVTGLTDNLEEIRALSCWVRSELSENVPLHFVRFHPAYRYTRVSRTPIPVLEKARMVAKDVGLKHVYIGNTCTAGHADLTCTHCGNLLVQRFGLYTRVPGVSIDARCLRCNKPQDLVPQPAPQPIQQTDEALLVENSLWPWKSEDTPNIHVEIRNTCNTTSALLCEHINKEGDIIDREHQTIPGKGVFRFAVARHAHDEKEIRLGYQKTVICKITELHDRAHFPLQSSD